MGVSRVYDATSNSTVWFEAPPNADGAPSTTLDDSDGNLLEPIPLLSIMLIAWIKRDTSYLAWSIKFHRLDEW
jgi:hypothetical protein